MNGKSLIGSLLLSSLLLAAPSANAALDPPHDATTATGCLSCHHMTSTYPKLLPPLNHTPLPGDIDDTISNGSCWTCHNDIKAPYVLTHSSLATSAKYGDWTVECWVCHNQHMQEQDRYNGSSYGKYIRRAINLANIKGGDGNTLGKTGIKSVKFLGQTGPNSFADGDGTYNGICEVCHTQTSHFQNNGGGADQLHTNAGSVAGSNCTAICHKHSNGFIHAAANGTDCDDCHNSGSHVTHISASILKGPSIFCDVCHDMENIPSMKDGVSLALTTVCNNCHSPGGVFNGVDAIGPSVGARDNWATGVYAGNILAAGKERWCDGCHDDVPANSKADNTGVSARNVLGDNSTYGYYQTGHGKNVTIDCLNCHSSRMKHIDHIYTPMLNVMKTTQNPTNYRFYVGKGMRMPYNGTDAPENRELCFSCHSQANLYNQSGLPAAATTNFRSDYADGTGYQNLHMSYHREWANCVLCHDPHGTSAPRMTSDERIGSFRLITLNAGDGKYYELSNSALWNSVAENHGGASTGSATGCGTCHSYTNLSAGASEPNMAMYQRPLVSISFQTVTDLDADGMADVNDNCPAVNNADQTDTDGDGVGDACDLTPANFDPSNRDRDYDSIGDVVDTCPDDPDNDMDGDGICVGAGYAVPKTGGDDNCPVNFNPSQADTDSDGFPDACDNCPLNANPDQVDTDFDGSGDACDAVCSSFADVWTQSMDTPPQGKFLALSLDADDNVYTAGYVIGSTFAGFTYAGGSGDFAMAKIDKNGNLLTKTSFGTADDVAWREQFEGVAVDNANGVVYATGYTTGSLSGYTNQGNTDIVIAKYDTALNQIWAQQIGSAAWDYGYAVAVDAAGNVYVGGKLNNQCSLVKYSPAGNETWNKQWANCTKITSVVVDGAYLYAGGQWDYGDPYVKQFGLDGSDGWESLQQNVAGMEDSISIAVTADNVFLSGHTGGSFPGYTLNPPYDIFVQKLDKTNGNVMATRQFTAPDLQEARGIATDAGGTEIFVTGFAWGQFLAPVTGQYDAFILSFDTDLNVLRKRQIATISSNQLEDIGVSKIDGSLYLTGNWATNNLLTIKEQKGCQ